MAPKNSHSKDSFQSERDAAAALPDVEERVFDVELRATTAGGAESPHIDGSAAVYNRWSDDLGGFREMIEPGFFEEVLKQDVRALWNHNVDMVLGRTRSGTLVLEDTERSLNVHIDPPDTGVGRDAVELIHRGDVNQMSFAFKVKPDGDTWSREKDGSIKRTLKRGGAAMLLDVSPVTYPAYRQTSVSVRSKLAELTGEGETPNPDEEHARAAVLARHANRKRDIQLRSK